MQSTCKPSIAQVRRSVDHCLLQFNVMFVYPENLHSQITEVLRTMLNETDTDLVEDTPG